MLRHTCILLIAITSTTLFAQEPDPAQPFELRDGDRVAFLGNSFFEQALDYGHIETSLSLRWPERHITFRNLGWDGDTVYGHSRTGGRRRAVFGDPAEGFQKMVAHVRSLDPTVIFLAYGFNESFDGQEGTGLFRSGLERLIAAIGSEKTRFVLLSPAPMEAGFGTELLDSNYVSGRNEILRLYRDAIAHVAQAGNHAFVDLFNTLQMTESRYSENGIHPSEDGYRRIAGIIGRQLELPPPRIDPDSKTADKIRAAIVRKNTLYFHRWRPRNDAFVYGERKDEQRIAQTEPEKFEPFIAEKERVIRSLLNQLAKPD